MVKDRGYHGLAKPFLSIILTLFLQRGGGKFDPPSVVVYITQKYWYEAVEIF